MRCLFIGLRGGKPTRKNIDALDATGLISLDTPAVFHPPLVWRAVWLVAVHHLPDRHVGRIQTSAQSLGQSHADFDAGCRSLRPGQSAFYLPHYLPRNATNTARVSCRRLFGTSIFLCVSSPLRRSNARLAQSCHRPPDRAIAFRSFRFHPAPACRAMDGSYRTLDRRRIGSADGTGSAERSGAALATAQA